MANDLSHNPWIIDTASATTPQWASPVWVKKVIWEKPTTDGDDVIIKNALGNEVRNKKALAGGTDIEYDLNLDFVTLHGFWVSTLDSGTVKVFVE